MNVLEIAISGAVAFTPQRPDGTTPEHVEIEFAFDIGAERLALTLITRLPNPF